METGVSAIRYLGMFDRDHMIRCMAHSGRMVNLEPLFSTSSLKGIQAGNPPTIDLLKCDIEGAEQEVFADCASWLHRVRNLVIELHEPYLADRFLQDIASACELYAVKVLKSTSSHQLLLLMS